MQTLRIVEQGGFQGLAQGMAQPDPGLLIAEQAFTALDVVAFDQGDGSELVAIAVRPFGHRLAGHIGLGGDAVQMNADIPGTGNRAAFGSVPSR